MYLNLQVSAAFNVPMVFSLRDREASRDLRFRFILLNELYPSSICLAGALELQVQMLPSLPNSISRVYIELHPAGFLTLPIISVVKIG